MADSEHVPLAEITPTIMPGQIEHLSDYQFESEFSDGAASPAPTQMATINQADQATGDIPSKEEFEGRYEFSLIMNWSNIGTKRTWEYASQLNKLYVKMSCFVPLQFKVSPDGAGRKLKVRGVLVYDADDDLHLAIERCPVHRLPTNKSNIEFPNYKHLMHVLSCKHRDTVYERNEQSGRYSIVVPLDESQPGSAYTTLLFGLISQVVGRKVLKVRVCSCPKRDMIQELETNRDNSTIRGKKRKAADPKIKVERITELPPEPSLSTPAGNPLVPPMERMLYVEVTNKRHYYQLLKRASDLNKIRAEGVRSMYDRLLQEAAQL
ncbi:hypothetical protein B566_EDAN016492 [Ephemera danica]|nr:hypothetical protein B566_EDAN016492 [Ephemera danica]